MRRKNGMDRKHRAGLYLRLSKEDEAQGQSGSISNQRAILERYAQDQGWEVAGCYIDDGYSGLHFDRPGFQRLLSDIEAGLVNLVLTKDGCVIIEPTQKGLENQGFVAGSICF